MNGKYKGRGIDIDKLSLTRLVDSGRFVDLEAIRIHSYDYYQEAVAWREQQKMPTVGISIDRRTIKHLSLGLNSCPPSSLVCACCQCQYTSVDGTNSEMGRVDAQDYFDMLSAMSFRYNCWFEEYMKRYGNTAAMENHEDLGKTWKFKRLVMHRNFKRQHIICCPEYIKCSEEHDRFEIRDCCLLPLCYRC